MCAYIDHTKHDLDVIVTEHGLTDMRGLCPVKRARLLIDMCVHPDFKDQMREYLNIAIQVTQSMAACHEPQILSKVFKMQENLKKKGTMKLQT